MSARGLGEPEGDVLLDDGPGLLAPSHVVWDWNGTLLDDFWLTARIANTTLAELGVPDVRMDHVRDNFTRPFSLFYTRLLGRPVTADEFSYIRRRYEAEYDAEVFDLSLQADAEMALDHVVRSATQSLLSMAPNEQLQSLVDHHAIRGRFLHVEGSPTSSSDGSKAQRLRQHLERLGVGSDQSVIIGDTVDDHEAAAACGARAVLLTSGSQSRAALEATGSPVVDTLIEAAMAATEAR